MYLKKSDTLSWNWLISSSQDLYICTSLLCIHTESNMAYQFFLNGKNSRTDDLDINIIKFRDNFFKYWKYSVSP